MHIYLCHIEIPRETTLAPVRRCRRRTGAPPPPFLRSAPSPCSPPPPPATSPRQSLGGGFPSCVREQVMGAGLICVALAVMAGQRRLEYDGALAGMLGGAMAVAQPRPTFVLLVLIRITRTPGRRPWAWRWYWSSPPSEMVGPMLDWRISVSSSPAAVAGFLAPWWCRRPVRRRQAGSTPVSLVRSD